MTKEEFIEQYVRRSAKSCPGLTKEKLFSYMDAYPCVCDYPGCQGWQMLTPDGAKAAKEMGHIRQGRR
jgi:hypothetical protein